MPPTKVTIPFVPEVFIAEIVKTSPESLSVSFPTISAVIVLTPSSSPKVKSVSVAAESSVASGTSFSPVMVTVTFAMAVL